MEEQFLEHQNLCILGFRLLSSCSLLPTSNLLAPDPRQFDDASSVWLLASLKQWDCSRREHPMDSREEWFQGMLAQSMLVPTGRPGVVVYGWVVDCRSQHQ